MNLPSKRVTKGPAFFKIITNELSQAQDRKIETAHRRKYTEYI